MMTSSNPSLFKSPVSTWVNSTSGSIISTAVLLAGYGLTRFLVEYVREPDPQLGLLAGIITMGQILCLPMMAAGAYLLWRQKRS